MSNKSKKKPIINAHTHVFTGNFVPPYLTKSIVPKPFYYLFNTGFILGLVKAYFKWKHKKEFGNSKDAGEQAKLWRDIYANRRSKRAEMKWRFNVSSKWYYNIPYKVIVFWLTAVAALYLTEFVTSIFKSTPFDWINDIKAWLRDKSLYYDLDPWLKAAWFFGVILFIKSSRRLIFQVLKALVPALKKIFSPQVLDLAERYWLLGRFSFYETQSKVSQRVLHQLPNGSEIVILPMDMEYMDAGKTKLTKKILESKDEKLAKGWDKKDFEDSFKYQMRELWELVNKSDDSGPKNKFHPFLFIDPRRVKEENEKGRKDGTEMFFDYELVRTDATGNTQNHDESNTDGEQYRMELKPSFLKTYMEDRRFSGFKIYPALGYYPFDDELLPIWRYAAENDIPIMTHCVKGVIYYRGAKKEEWNFHPVFKMKYGVNPNELDDPDVIEELDDVHEKTEDDANFDWMMLPETKPIDFQINFTHPLNYLCLVEDKFLITLIKKSKKSEELKKVFGYDEDKDTIKYNLHNLKICLAHFGGEGEWTRYMEQDRNNYSQRLMRDPVTALRFMQNSRKEFSWFKINDLWHKTDWYSLICSLLIEYENIYADISFMLSKPSIYPLLKYSLEKGDKFDAEHEKYLAEPDPNKKAAHYTGKNKLRSRILFGTDFYVVRNLKSDKNMFVQTKTYLGTEAFDLIARENTHNYLTRKYKPIKQAQEAEAE